MLPNSHRRWPIAAIVILLLMISGIFLATDQKSEETHAGGLFADQSTFEIHSQGKVSEVERLMVQLRNTSNTPISITDVRTTCGCTIPGRPPLEPIPPGMAFELPLSITLPAVGTKRISVTVTSDCVQTPLVRLQIAAIGRSIAAPYLKAGPQQVRLSASRPGVTVEREFVLETIEMRDASPWIVGLQGASTWLRAELLGSPESADYLSEFVKRSYRFRVTGTLPNDSNKRANASLTLVTNPRSTGESPVISLTGEIIPPVRAIPSRFAVRFEDGKVLVERTLVLAGEGVGKWTCQVDHVPDGISIASISKAQENNTKRFLVSINQSKLASTDPDQELALRFSTGIVDQPFVAVPIVVIR